MAIHNAGREAGENTLADLLNLAEAWYPIWLATAQARTNSPQPSDRNMLAIHNTEIMEE